MKIEDEIRKAIAALRLRLKEIDRQITALRLIESRQRPLHRCRRRASLLAVILLAMAVFSMSVRAESKTETALRAQLAQERAVSQAAIEKLQARNSDDAAAATQAVQVTADKIQTKVDAITPGNSVPVWLAAIGAIVSTVVVIGNIVLAFINQTKLAEIHVLANGNLAQMKGELRDANEKIAELREIVGVAKGQSAR